MSASNIYFVVSCARSGSTSLTRILDTATNGICRVEPMPNFNVESRDMMEGRVSHPHGIISRDLTPRIAEALDQGHVYGEKNVTLGPFIPAIRNLVRCKWVFLTRDGRDVATSLMNWHNEAFGTIYRECKHAGRLSKQAEEVASSLSIEADTSDYSRPRPSSNDPFAAEWKEFSRFEMVTWYWSFINNLYLDRLSELPSDEWMRLDYTNVTAEDIERIFDFAGLTGFDASTVREMLAQKINSVWDRFQLHTRFPAWQDWTKEQRRQFDRIAAPTMKKLGYAADVDGLLKTRRQVG